MLIGRYMSSKLLLIMIAFLIGLSLEDLIYKDWDIIKNNCHKSKLTIIPLLSRSRKP